MATIGRIVEQKRLARGWERARLAREANVDARSLYNLETGRTEEMRSELFERVAKALGTTTDALKEEAKSGLRALELPADVAEMIERHAEQEKMNVGDWLRAVVSGELRPFKGRGAVIHAKPPKESKPAVIPETSKRS